MTGGSLQAAIVLVLTLLSQGFGFVEFESPKVNDYLTFILLEFNSPLGC